MKISQAFRDLMEVSKPPSLPPQYDPGEVLREIFRVLRDARRRISSLARAAEPLDELVDVHWQGDLKGYDLVVTGLEGPALGGGLGDNLELRVSSCRRCGSAVDFLGRLGTWSCTNVECPGTPALLRRSPLDERRRGPRTWGR